MFYKAGDITPDGQYLYCIGSDVAGNDVNLTKIDLNSFSAQSMNLNGTGHLSDIAIQPSTQQIYGFDSQGLRMVKINPTTATSSAFPIVTPGNFFSGLYFDAFGDLYAIGTTLYGIVDGYFSIHQFTGLETRLTTGPTTMVSDCAGCPYSIELKSNTAPGITLPCNDMEFQYHLANGTGETITGAEFIHPLPPGVQLVSVLQNDFGALVDTASIPGSLRIVNLDIYPGVKKLTLKMHVGDVPKERYNSQPLIKQLPQLYGGICLSDYTKEPGFEDSTAFIVNRFDDDTLNYLWFICHGEILTLDATEFGAGIHWNTGSFAPTLDVDHGGLYQFKAGTSCEEVFVNHDVTSGSCPYTVAVEHTFAPDTTFACSEVVFRFVFRNDSGEPRFNLSFCDTFPTGFSYQNIIRNPFGGISNNIPGDPYFCMEGMTLHEGRDTLEVLVKVDEIAPGNYKSRGLLFGLPLVMGPFRQSDNPYTFVFDSSVLVVKGALADTLILDTLICANAQLILDASPYGKSFLWENGSVDPTFMADSAGFYSVTIFDGCEPAQIIWRLSPGPEMDILPIDPIDIHQGQQAVFHPQITNGGQYLNFSWNDPFPGSLNCQTCIANSARPLQTAIYIFKAWNELCTDSINIEVRVDPSRRLYFPNVFSPNDDGIHDEYVIQSPDYAFLKHFRVHDRWGSCIYQLKDQLLNDQLILWDGRWNGKKCDPGVYTWDALFEFIDGKTKGYQGNITIVR
ncbi:MAG: gliding motility-associated C-terminal domain-containing protein [Saprospiraceae bacterium]|nr:gliding motility-associated C-terminal domain-containing protein [Saprospiraceae bacterium]